MPLQASEGVLGTSPGRVWRCFWGVIRRALESHGSDLCASVLVKPLADTVRA